MASLPLTQKPYLLVEMGHTPGSSLTVYKQKTEVQHPSVVLSFALMLSVNQYETMNSMSYLN